MTSARNVVLLKKLVKRKKQRKLGKNQKSVINSYPNLRRLEMNFWLYTIKN